MMTMVLLMVALSASAQTNGVLECNGAKLYYSFAGGNITGEGNPHSGIQRSFTCEVKPGTSLSFKFTGDGRTNPKTGQPEKVSFKIRCSTDKRNESNGQRLHFDTIRMAQVPYSYTVPRNAGVVRVDATYENGTRIPCYINIKFYVVDDPSGTDNSIQPDEPDERCNCQITKGIPEEWTPKYRPCGVRFNDITGDVSVRPCDEDDDAYESAEFDTILNYCDMIKTEIDSEAILSLTDKTSFTIKEKTRVVLPAYEGEVSNLKMLAGVVWINLNKMVFNKGELRLHGTNAVAGIRGTIVAMEETGSETRFWLLAGKVEVTSKKTKKKVMLSAGQRTITGKDGKIVVKEFDVKQAAKKFGIPMKEIEEYYATHPSTTTTTTTTTKRYELERAIVKYKVTTGNQQGILAKAFDNYGTLERRELKKGDNVTIALTQGNVSYALDKKTKIAKRTKDADLNFLDFTTPLMKKLNLQKKGTATVIGKKCTLYTGKNVEYYVWKGLVMKKVQHNSNGTTTVSEVTSIEEPTSVDPKLFKLPSGYTVK